MHLESSKQNVKNSSSRLSIEYHKYKSNVRDQRIQNATKIESHGGRLFSRCKYQNWIHVGELWTITTAIYAAIKQIKAK